MALSERTPALCRIPSRRSRMRATKSRVGFEGFARFRLTFVELLPARLDPLRMHTIVRECLSVCCPHNFWKMTATAPIIMAKPTRSFHFNGPRRSSTEKTENTISVMTSWMLFSCAVVNSGTPRSPPSKAPGFRDCLTNGLQHAIHLAGRPDGDPNT